MFSTVAFVVMGVASLFGAGYFYNEMQGLSHSLFSTNPLEPVYTILMWASVGLAVQCFIGAELSSIWRRTAEATEASTEVLKMQTDLLKKLAAAVPNVAVAAAAQEGGEQG